MIAIPQLVQKIVLLLFSFTIQISSKQFLPVQPVQLSEACKVTITMFGNFNHISVVHALYIVQYNYTFILINIKMSQACFINISGDIVQRLCKM